MRTIANIKYRYYKGFQVLLWLFALIYFCSCKSIKSIPAKDKLYIGATVKIETDGWILKKNKKKELESELVALTRPVPNVKLFGLVRLKLWAYNHAGIPKKKGLRYLIRTKLGEPPVLYSSVNPEHNRQILINHLENEGYFVPDVSYTVEIDKKERVKLIYTVKVTNPYTILKVIFPEKDSSINKLITATAGSTYLTTGSAYNLETLKQERDRISTALKEQGLIYFTGDDIVFKADTTAGNHQVNIYVRVKRNIPIKATRIYRLHNIYIHANHSLFKDSTTIKPDTVFTQGYYYIRTAKLYRPEIIVSSIFLQKDSIFNQEDYDITLSRLMRLGVYKFVNIRFQDLDTSAKKGLLDTYIYLTPLPLKSLKTELRLVAKSDNYAGPLINVSLKNRNVFRGAETLTFNINGSIETEITGFGRGLTSSTIGTDAVLSIPRFLIPFVSLNPATKYVPKTELRIGFQKLSELQYYNLNTFSFSAGYRWNQSEKTEHILNPIVVTFLKLGNSSLLFDSILNKNISLKRSFATQFIIGSFYSFTYNSQVIPERKFDIYFNGTIDVSGNLLGLLQSPFENHQETADHPYKIFDEPYSQYVLGTVDFRHYINIKKQYRFVSRIFAGLGIPYGNSATLPYIKEFFAGGNSSVRAFPSRLLGPGSYHASNDQANTFFINQVGDMKLEANIEYRFPIAGAVKGAVFTDAGNIWLLQNDTSRPGGQFNFNSFYKQIAVGSGVGIRVDASYFVLRVDLAVPLRKPYPTDGNYWVLDAIKPLNGYWRAQNLVLNIGIGYPF